MVCVTSAKSLWNSDLTYSDPESSPAPVNVLLCPETGTLIAGKQRAGRPGTLLLLSKWLALSAQTLACRRYKKRCCVHHSCDKQVRRDVLLALSVCVWVCVRGVCGKLCCDESAHPSPDRESMAITHTHWSGTSLPSPTVRSDTPRISLGKPRHQRGKRDWWTELCLAKILNSQPSLLAVRHGIW